MKRYLGARWIGVVAGLWLASGALAHAQEAAKPYMLLITDTSGSMQGARIAAAKAALANVVGSAGEVIWGLQRFGQTCSTTQPCACAPAPSPGTLHNPGCAGEAPIVPLGAESQEEILDWVDGTCDFPGGNPELVIPTSNTAYTPLGFSLDAALTYLQTVSPTDPYWGCRPYYVILLTDGQETCGGDPEASAGALLTAGIRTLVIGFGFPPGNAELDAIAVAGGTGPSAVYVQADEVSLALALLDIISDSVLVEICNGVDDDCDCPGDTNGDGTICGPGDQGVDEGFALGQPCDNGLTGLCYRDGLTVCRPDGLGVECGAPLVAPPEDPEVTCDGSDNDCDCPGDTNGDGCACCAGDYNVDEGLTNACGGCGTVPAEVCDWLDNDCNGIIDDVAGAGTPCAHEDAPGPVGDEGECSLGTLQCQGDGPLVCVGAVGPTTEVCDCLDNDCDGSSDEPPGVGEPELCPTGSECVDCFCVSPCRPGEFPCPPGYLCSTDNQCVPDECTQARCPAGTYCALTEFCQGSDCTGTCAGACPANAYCEISTGACHDRPCLDLCLRCVEGERCDDGVCLPDDCYHFPEYCQLGAICLQGTCVANPCKGVLCEDDQFCRDASCIDSCAFIHCPSGQTCHDGLCAADPCAEVTCDGSDICRSDGTCGSDPCRFVTCGAFLTCIDGDCVDDHCTYIQCPQGAVCRQNECVAPEERHWVKETGCGCEAGGTGGPAAPLFVLFGLLALLYRRQRAGAERRRQSAIQKWRARAARRWLPALFALTLGLNLAVLGGCETTWKCKDCHECVPTKGGVEVCDNEDNDCDCPGDTNGDGWWCGPGDEGVDEDFDLMTDVGNCGACGHACILPNAVAGCQDGTCIVESCVATYYDANEDASDGCEYGCLPTNGGVEICDGVDNDCDCVGNTNGDDCFCCEGDEGVDEAEDIPGLGLACGLDEGECALGVTACTGGYIQCVNEIGPSVELCDGLDNDCNGSTDEIFLTKGAPCFRGVGACMLQGAYTCDATGTDVLCGCVEVIGGGVCDQVGDEIPETGNAAASSGEVWNDLDDDCNGIVDDGIVAVEDMIHVAYTHPSFGAMDFWIYTYEASRPDATAMGGGTVDSHPQSRPGVIPWTVASFAVADAACQAAGKRLCTEEEWQAACESDEIRTYPYGGTYTADTCNDNPYDADPGTVDDDDALVATGSLTGCVTKDGIFDMAGNAKEWTSTQVSTNPDAWRIRGGAYDSPIAGTTCTFDFTAGDGAYVFGNLGFRCCSDTAP